MFVNIYHYGLSQATTTWAPRRTPKYEILITGLKDLIKHEDETPIFSREIINAESY